MNNVVRFFRVICNLNILVLEMVLPGFLGKLFIPPSGARKPRIARFILFRRINITTIYFKNPPCYTGTTITVNMVTWWHCENHRHINLCRGKIPVSIKIERKESVYGFGYSVSENSTNKSCNNNMVYRCYYQLYLPSFAQV